MAAFLFETAALRGGGLPALRQALSRCDVVDASGVAFKASDVAALGTELPAPNGAPLCENWRFRDAAFEDGCDFSKWQFRSTDFSRARFGAGTSFRDAAFTYGRFGATTFGDEASFERCAFSTKADFQSAQFGARTRFAYASFRVATFVSAGFGVDAGFARSRFLDKANFHGARFGERANFTEVAASPVFDLSGTDFGAKLQMVSLRAPGHVSFVGAALGDRARLTNWRVAGSLIMRSTRFLGDMSLHGARIGDEAEFENASFHGWVDLGDVWVRGATRMSQALVATAERIGPLDSDGQLDLSGLSLLSPCVLEIGAEDIDLSDSHFNAPVRLVIRSGDLKLQRLDTESRVVIRACDHASAGAQPRLISVAGADVNTIVVSGMDVRPLKFAAAVGIDGLHLESGATFATAPTGLRTRREVIAEEHRLRSKLHPDQGWLPPSAQCENIVHPDAVSTEEVARIYRGLRKAREDARDFAGAADFYYGEMEMRRLGARMRFKQAEGLGDHGFQAGNALLLESYRTIGGYGVRPSRPLALLVLAVLSAAIVVDCFHLVHELSLSVFGTAEGASEDFLGSLVFVLRSALLLPTSTSVTVSSGGEWVQVIARVFGPVLLGLIAFGLRTRIRR